MPLAQAGCLLFRVSAECEGASCTQEASSLLGAATGMSDYNIAELWHVGKTGVLHTCEFFHIDPSTILCGVTSARRLSDVMSSSVRDQPNTSRLA